MKETVSPQTVHVDISNNKHLYTDYSFYHKQHMGGMVHSDSELQLRTVAYNPAGLRNGNISAYEHDSETLLRHSQDRQRMFGDPLAKSSCNP